MFWKSIALQRERGGGRDGERGGIKRGVRSKNADEDTDIK